MPYYGLTGEDIAVKQRTALKAKDGSYWPKGKPLAAYGQWRLNDAAKAGFLILVEGESDCWTLWHHGLPALGLPGATTIKTLLREHVEAVQTVYVHREPDDSGAGFVARVRERLGGLGFAGKVYQLRMPAGVKDPADLHAADPAKFKVGLEKAILAATPIDLPQTVERNGKPNSEAKPGSAAVKKARPAPEPYQPFPVETLPEPIRAYVIQGAQALGCDPAFLALPALAVVAALIGNTRTIRLKRGWEEPSVVWAALVADSGTLKSPAYLKAVGFIFRLQKRLRAAYKQKMVKYQKEKEAYQAAKRTAREEGTPPPDAPEEPVLQRVVCSDTTIEKLAEILEDNPRGILLARDELAGWLGSFTRYKGKQGGSDLPHWLEMFRAGTILVDRKTGARTHYFVERAATSVAGGIQPGVLARAMTFEFFDAGLAARLLMAMPPKLPKHWSEVEVSPEVEQAYENVLDKLLALNLDFRDGEAMPHILRLSEDAKAAWVAFYDKFAREQAAVEGEVAAAFSKLEAYAARFALLHHVVSRVARGENDVVPVARESIEAGVKLCRWFANEAQRIYATLAETEEDRNTRKLIEFIRSRGGAISTHALQKSNSRKYPEAGAAQVALDALAQAGWGEWNDRPPAKQGGRPTRTLVLRPTPDKTDTTPDDGDGDGDDGPQGPSDTTPDTSQPTPVFSRENRGCVGNAAVGQKIQDRRPEGEPPAVPEGGCVAPGEVVSDGGGAVPPGWFEGIL